MGDKSSIEWTNATWNVIVGCSVVSPGCTNCYAMKTAGARTKHTAKYQGLTEPSKAGPVWTGDVRFWEKALRDPLKWREPRRVFVNSMGDLFHEDIPDEWIDRVFAVMALAPQHTFQVLTKRPERMRAYMTSLIAGRRKIADAALKIMGSALMGIAAISAMHRRDEGDVLHPLPNVWLGVSCEDQRRADERIPILLDTPAAVRFISAEPLLGPIDLTKVHRLDQRGWLHRADQDLDWVIVGGESGRGARPMHPDWVKSIRDQCRAAGVAFFFKQWGKWGPIDHSAAADEAGWQGRGNWMILDREGELDIPDHRWPDEEAGEVAVVDVGKGKAGRDLDGRTWDQYPEARP